MEPLVIDAAFSERVAAAMRRQLDAMLLQHLQDLMSAATERTWPDILFTFPFRAPPPKHEHDYVWRPDPMLVEVGECACGHTKNLDMGAYDVSLSENARTQASLDGRRARVYEDRSEPAYYPELSPEEKGSL